MKKVPAFLMMLIYLGFVTGQVWNCCEANNFSSITGKEATFIKTEGSGNSPESSISKNICLKKSSHHLSVAKIKLSRFTCNNDDSFKSFVFSPSSRVRTGPFTSALNFSLATPLFIRNRVLLI